MAVAEAVRRYNRRMVRKMVLILSFVGMMVAVWPSADSLYDLTGEEEIAGQMVGVLHWLQTATRPQPDLANDATLIHTEVVPFGMNTFLEKEVLPEVREEALRLLSEGGFRFIRQQFVWEDIEIHAKGDFIDRRNNPNGVDAWLKYDNIVDLAEQYKITIIARIDNPPAWSRAQGNEIGPHAPPDNFDDYGDFVAAVVERYRGRITYFQLWNEPNIYPEWGEQRPNPEAFTRLLCTGYERAKEANPSAIILAPALGPTIAVYGRDRDLNDLIYLQRMYDSGAGDCFDVFSAQGYGLRSSPADQRLQPLRINYTHPLYLRDILVKNGDAHKPVWISESGWNAVTDDLLAGAEPTYGQVTLDQQARYAVELYERARTDWPWVGVINYWFLKEPAPYNDQQYYYFRLMEPDFTPYPAWDALTAYANNPPSEQSAKDVGGNPMLFSISLAVFSFTLMQLLMVNGEWLMVNEE